MVSHLFYYQLALLALIWLFVMLHLSWPRRSATPPPAPATPIKPKRKRSTEPKAFEGLTHKPHCALCEQETGETTPAPPRRPDPMPPTHRRPRTVDTSMHFCPHTECRLSRLAGAEQPAGQWPSQWRPLAAVSLHRVRRLFSRTSWHHLSRQAGGGGADRPGAGLLGRGARHSCHCTGL